ncbi:DUF6415 family natural product biosynthesis protein [Streptomyces sp. NPDC057382]|uniref:DUF6415 family natural product biosynthesis protein n=1 Tax=unclassified Streptomyces TaxID=2593676 RepID=UPI0036398852
MSAPAQAPRWTHPVRPAQADRFNPDRLRWVLQKVQTWAPYVDGHLLDDIARVVDDYTPTEAEVDDSALRLRGHLMRLVRLADAAQVTQDERVTELVERARTVRSEELPGDHRRAVGHIRRMAWTLEELLDRLVAVQCLAEEPENQSLPATPLPEES